MVDSFWNLPNLIQDMLESLICLKDTQSNLYDLLNLLLTGWADQLFMIEATDAFSPQNDIYEKYVYYQGVNIEQECISFWKYHPVCMACLLSLHGFRNSRSVRLILCFAFSFNAYKVGWHPVTSSIYLDLK